MAELTADEVQDIQAQWPVESKELPPPVRDVYDAWYAFRWAEIKSAVEAMSGSDDCAYELENDEVLTRAEIARLLTVYGWGPVPTGVPKPSVDELKSVLTYTVDENNDPGLRALIFGKIASLEDDLKRAQVTIQSLSRTSSVDGDVDVAGEYDVADAVVQATPASFVSLVPLSKQDRQSLLRKHMGVYPPDIWPKSLSLKEATKLSADIKKASKIELTEFANAVSKWMDRNSVSTKMAGTVWSRLLDLRDDVDRALDEDDQAVIKADALRALLGPMIEAAEAAFTLGLDTSANMRYDVAKKVDVAMGIDHLRVDPHKRGTDDFLSNDTFKLVEAAAKTKTELAIAKQGVFPGSSAYFSNGPPRKPSGGGDGWRKKGKGNGYQGGRSNSNSRGGRGGGRGGRGRGGRGKGKGDKGASSSSGGD